MTTKSFAIKRFLIALGIASVAATVHGAWFVSPDAAEAPAPVARVRVSVWDPYEKAWASQYIVGGQTIRGAEGDVIELRPENSGDSIASLPAFVEPFSLGAIPPPAPASALLQANGTPTYGRLRLSQPVYAAGDNVNNPAGEVDAPDQFDLTAIDTNGSVGVNLVHLSVGADSVSFSWDVTRWAKGDVFVGLNNSSYKVIDRDGNFKRYIGNSDFGRVDDNGDAVAPITTGCAANWHTGEVYMTNFAGMDPAVNVVGRHPGSGPLPYSRADARLSTAIFRSNDPVITLDPDTNEPIEGFRYPIDGSPESIVFDGNQNMYVGNSFGHFASVDEASMDANYKAIEYGGQMVDELGDPVQARRISSGNPFESQIYGDVSARLETDGDGNLIFAPHTFTWGTAPDETATLSLPNAFWEDAVSGAWLERSTSPGSPWPFRWPLGKRLHKYNNTNPNPDGSATFDAADRDVFWTFTSRQGTDWIDLASDQRTMYYTSENSYIYRYDTQTGQQLPSLGGRRLGSPMQKFHTLRILPPGDGSGGVIVAAEKEIFRINGNGDVVQTYIVEGDDDVQRYYNRANGLIQEWYALEVDPGGRTFWAAAHDTGRLYQIDLATGAVLRNLRAVDYRPFEDAEFPDGRRVEGICIMWEYTAAQEVCGDGIDNDGDGFIDESCQAIESCSALSPGDDDGDGLVDHNDPDCGDERPPTAFNDSYVTNEGVPLLVPASGVVVNDTDPDNTDGDPLNDDPLLVGTVGTGVGSLSASNVGVAIPTEFGGTVVLQQNGSFLYTPASGFHGRDTWMYQTTDGAALSNEATVEVLVRPRVADDSYTMLQRGMLSVNGLNVSPAGILVNDSSQPMSVSAAGSTLGTVVPFTFGRILTSANGGQVFVSSNGYFQYQPLPSFVGVDTFVYRGNDGFSDSSNTATVTITVEDVNELVAVNDAISTAHATPVTINVRANDVDPEGHTFQVTHVNGQAIAIGQTVTVVHGTVTRNAAGNLVVTPELGYVGLVTFTYTIQDSPTAPMLPVSSTARVDVTVGASQLGGLTDNYTTPQNTQLSVNLPGVLVNDFGVGILSLYSAGISPTLTVSNGAWVTFTTANGGSVTIRPDGGFAYTPAPQFVGVDNFQYRLVDTLLTPSSVVSVFITVTPTSTVVPSTTPNPSNYGTAVPLTARVTCGASTTPTGGTVTFRLGSTVVASGVPVVNGVATFTLPASQAAGTYAVTADYSGVVNQCPASTGASSHRVNPAPLTVTANPQTKVYGSTFTFSGNQVTATGLLLSDTVTGATMVSAGAIATASVAGSTYPITPSAAVGTGLANYTITYVDGPMTVTPKPLTITANSRSKAYGTTVTFAGNEFVATGLVNGDAVTSVSLTSEGAPAATSANTTHPIVPSAAVGTGLANYSITYTNGTLTVTPRVLTVTANNLSKVYGTTATFAGTEFTVAGLYAGDSVSSVSLSSTGAPALANANATYPIVPSAAIGTGLTNYTITYVNGTLTITPAAIVVVATDKTKVQGAANPVLDGTGTGVVAGDNITWSYSTAATQTSPAGVYPITPVLSDPDNRRSNYIVTLTNGTLTVTGGSGCSVTGFVTYSQGGWGTKPSGNNPGQLLVSNFGAVYPGGSVSIGGTRSLTFTSAAAIQSFLPQGGTPASLTKSATNPTSSSAGNLAAQVLALRLAVDFSAAGKTKTGLGSLVMISGPFAGQTVIQILAVANAVLGGQTSALPSGMAVSTLNGIVESLNLNFHEGTVNNGLLQCGGAAEPPCAAITVAFTGNSATSGSAGNIRSFSTGGVAVKASAFSRAKSGGAWAEAYLGVWNQGLGVTDGSEGTGGNDTHKVDNGGDRLNYVLFEFSEPVAVTQAYLDSIGEDSDATVWIGTKANPYTNHQTLSDAFLSSLGGAQESAGASSARWATFNSSKVTGNILVIAAKTSESNDAFKVSKLTIACSAVPTNRTPDAVPDTRTTQGTAPVAIPVLTNDTDPDGDTLTVVSTGYTQPANGSVTLSGGVFTFVANAGFTGTTTFTYTISDGKGGTDTATVTVTVQPNEVCYVGTARPQVGANQTWWLNSDGTITIRTTLSRNFVDNTYGSNEIGWPGDNHTFNHLTGSDAIQVALYSQAGARVLEVKLDYLTSSSSFPSGYGSLGVSGGDGSMVYGSSSNVVRADSSLAKNFNVFGYRLTSNSPSTTNSYATNASYPNWIWDVYYEVTVKASAFGSAGFGYPRLTSMHASPSKTGSNTEPVAVTECGDAGEPPANAAPVAVNNTYVTPKATALVVGGTGLLGNDTDPDEDDLTVVKVNGSTASVGQSIRLPHGYVKVNANGTFTYTPDSSYTGTETFTYQVTDGAITSGVATVTITVSSHSDGDDCDHDRGRGKHKHGDDCDHDRACDNDDDRDGHHRGDNCDHDRGKKGHRKGDNCDHDRDDRRSDDHKHSKGDRCDHDRGRNGHRDGDNCDHDRDRGR